MDLTGGVSTKLPRVGEFLQQNHPSPNGAKSSPSYAKITKKNPVDSLESSDEDSIEKLSKKVGRKYRKEA